ncbi:MAG TPA: KH domain-containing protein [Candidatus Moranbacteria bacterium]|nr:KH domain-containing protein [Candidatus Moranbacteria bacterium]
MSNQNASKETKKIVTQIVNELVKKMGLSAEIEIQEVDTEEEQKKIICNIKSQESNFLIGQYGINLQALQHIARLLIRRKIGERVNFILDVNAYRQEKDASIVALAKNMAQQAIAEKKEIILRPMSPYERRLVHLELADNTQIKTESIGEKENRRIVIKPANVVE